MVPDSIAFLAELPSDLDRQGRLPAAQVDGQGARCPHVTIPIGKVFSWKFGFYELLLPALRRLGPATGDRAIGLLGKAFALAYPGRRKRLRRRSAMRARRSRSAAPSRGLARVRGRLGAVPRPRLHARCPGRLVRPGAIRGARAGAPEGRHGRRPRRDARGQPFRRAPGRAALALPVGHAGQRPGSASGAHLGHAFGPHRRTHRPEPQA